MINLYCKNCGDRLFAQNDVTDNQDVDQANILVFPCKNCVGPNKKLKEAIRTILDEAN